MSVEEGKLHCMLFAALQMLFSLSSSWIIAFIDVCSGKDQNTAFIVAQIAFMKQLMVEGISNTSDIVFLDMDALVVDTITEV